MRDAGGHDLGERELDALMARLAEGDRRAFDPLFRALHPRAVRVARARLGLVTGDREALAEDVAQAALVRVFARATEFEQGRPVLPWFYAVVANEIRAVTRARDARHGALDEGLEATLIASDDPERLLADRELHAALDLAIVALDAPSADAIASLLGRAARPDVAKAAFRKRVSRAYARLRVLLGGER